MPQPDTASSLEATLSALLFLFHRHSAQFPLERAQARVTQRIQLLLQNLGTREDVPPALRGTCDELADAWAIRMDEAPR